MKFQITPNNFARLLSAQVGNPSALQILGMAKLTAGEGVLQGSSTDLETSVVSTVGANILEAGEVLVNFEAMLNLIKTINAETLLFETKDGDRKVNIKAGTTKANFATMSVDEFPIINLDGKLFASTSASKLLEALRIVSKFAAVKDTYPILNSVQFQFKETFLMLAGSDGYALGTARIDAEIAQPVSREYVIPLKAAQHLIKILTQLTRLNKDCVVEIGTMQSPNGANKLLFTLNAADTIAVEALEGRYPIWDKIAPIADPILTLIIMPDQLNATLNRIASAMSNLKIVEITFDGENLTLSARSDEGDISDNPNYLNILGSEPFRARFALQYLKSAVVGTNSIELSIFGVDKPAVIKTGEFKFVIMPISR